MSVYRNRVGTGGANTQWTPVTSSQFWRWHHRDLQMMEGRGMSNDSIRKIEVGVGTAAGGCVVSSIGIIVKYNRCACGKSLSRRRIGSIYYGPRVLYEVIALKCDSPRTSYELNRRGSARRCNHAAGYRYWAVAAYTDTRESASIFRISDYMLKMNG